MDNNNKKTRLPTTYEEVKAVKNDGKTTTFSKNEFTVGRFTVLAYQDSVKSFVQREDKKIEQSKNISIGK